MKNRFSIFSIVLLSIVAACNVVTTKDTLTIPGKELTRFPNTIEGSYILSNFDSAFIWVFMIDNPFEKVTNDTISYKALSLNKKFRKQLEIKLVVQNDNAFIERTVFIDSKLINNDYVIKNDSILPSDSILNIQRKTHNYKKENIKKLSKLSEIASDEEKEDIATKITYLSTPEHIDYIASIKFKIKNLSNGYILYKDTIYSLSLRYGVVSYLKNTFDFGKDTFQIQSFKDKNNLFFSEKMNKNNTGLKFLNAKYEGDSIQLKIINYKEIKNNYNYYDSILNDSIIQKERLLVLNPTLPELQKLMLIDNFFETATFIKIYETPYYKLTLLLIIILFIFYFYLKKRKK